MSKEDLAKLERILNDGKETDYAYNGEDEIPDEE